MTARSSKLDRNYPFRTSAHNSSQLLTGVIPRRLVGGRDIPRHFHPTKESPYVNNFLAHPAQPPHPGCHRGSNELVPRKFARNDRRRCHSAVQGELSGSRPP